MVKLRKIFYNIILVSLSYLIVGCPEEGLDYDAYYFTVNNSTENIVWYGDVSVVSDTSLKEQFPWEDATNFLLKPGDTAITYFNEESMQKSFNNYVTHFYFFNYDTIKNNLWEDIRSDYKILKRLDIKAYKELVDMNFILSYP